MNDVGAGNRDEPSLNITMNWRDSKKKNIECLNDEVMKNLTTWLKMKHSSFGEIMFNFNKNCTFKDLGKFEKLVSSIEAMYDAIIITGTIYLYQ